MRVWLHSPLLSSNSPQPSRPTEDERSPRAWLPPSVGAAPEFWFSREAGGRKLDSCLGLEGRGGEGRTNGLQAGWVGRMGQDKEWEVGSRLGLLCVAWASDLFHTILGHIYILLCVHVCCLGPATGRNRDLSREDLAYSTL